MSETLFPALAGPEGREAIRIADSALTYAELAGAAAALASRLDGARRVAVWAEPTLELCVAVVGALAAGVSVVPINPRLGPRELGHIVEDSGPDRLLARAGVEAPPRLAALDRIDIDLDIDLDADSAARDAVGAGLPDALGEEDVAFVMYTSGRRGRPRACRSRAGGDHLQP